MQNPVLRRVILNNKYRSPEVRQYFARIAEPSSGEKTILSTLIDGIVADGDWAKFDWLYDLGPASATTAYQNLKSGSYTLNPIGSPTFTAGRGFSFGVGASLDTGHTPGSGVMVSNSNHIGCYCLTSRTTGQAYIQMGSNHDPSGDGLHIFPKNTDNNTYYANQAVDNAHALSANASGHYINTRTTNTLVTLYRNGSSFNTDTGTGSGNLPNRSIYIGSLNAGSVLFPTSDEISFAHGGGALDGAAEARVSARVNAAMTSRGINVY